MRVIWPLWLGLCTCAPAPRQVSGSTMLVDLAPHGSPPVVGAYDFELLGSGAGKACVSRDDRATYWVGLADLDRMSDDPLTRQAIAAAALDAISRLEDVDSIVITRITTEAKGDDKVCATLVGRGVRLLKAEPATTPSTTTPTPPAATPSAGSAGEPPGSGDDPFQPRF
jgi:hypothetical protein